MSRRITLSLPDRVSLLTWLLLEVRKLESDSKENKSEMDHGDEELLSLYVKVISELLLLWGLTAF